MIIIIIIIIIMDQIKLVHKTGDMDVSKAWNNNWNWTAIP